MAFGIKSASVTRVTVLVALLLATVVVASLLAYEAHDASRSERVTVERALQDYATLAAWELQSASHKRVESALQQALSPVITGAASSPYEALLPLSAVSATAQGLLPCASAVPDRARAYARLDLRDGSVTTSGSVTALPPDGFLTDAMRRFVQLRAAPEQPVGLTALTGDRSRALAVGVKYAMHGAPLAVYAFSICGEALGATMVRGVMATHPLLPSAVRGAVANDSLIVVQVTDAGGRVAYATGSASTPYAATVVLDSALGIQARVSVREAAATRLLVERPSSSRVPVLVALLALTAALAGVALLQLRREHQLARLRADFTSSVSHELRTPLAQILLFGETLSLGRTRDEEEQALAARTIVAEARRLMRMVDNILVFERGRRSPVAAGVVETDLAPLAADVVRSFDPLAAAAGSEVVLQLAAGASAPSATRMRGDPAIVRQILLNLLDNAVKYGPRGQQVVVRVEVVASGKELCLTVADEGPGIPVEARERIWEPYVRLPVSGLLDRTGEGLAGRTPRTAAGGSGLGLAVVRELCTALGGRIWVEDAGRAGEGAAARERVQADAAGGAEGAFGAGGAGATTGRGGGARFVWTMPRVAPVAVEGRLPDAEDEAGVRGAPPKSQDTSASPDLSHPFVATPSLSNAPSQRTTRPAPR